MTEPATFPLNPFRFQRAQTARIKRPTEIACFSYDDNGVYHEDASSLRYYYTPAIGASLSDGFATFRESPDNGTSLENLLKTLEAVERRSGVKTEADFVTWRGMGTQLMTAIYNQDDAFEMTATPFHGTIYIEQSREFKLRKQAEEKQQQQQQKRSRPGQAGPDVMAYWGYKFETLCTLPDTWDATTRDYIENRETAIVSNYAQYVSIIETAVQGIKLIFGGEVDAIWDHKSPTSTTHNYVELKTTAQIVSHHDTSRFHRKLLKYWAQSFLLGVPRIIVGFRSKDASGRLLSVETYETRDLPAIVKGSGGSNGRERLPNADCWDKDVCVNFLGDVLRWVRECVIGEGTEGGVWRIRMQPKSGRIECERIEREGHGGILTLEWVKWRMELKLRSDAG